MIRNRSITDIGHQGMLQEHSQKENIKVAILENKTQLSYSFTVLMEHEVNKCGHVCLLLAIRLC